MSTVVEAPPEPTEAFTEAEILEFVREVAAHRDPWPSLPYDTASPARIKQAAFTAQRLIETHLRYLRHYPATVVGASTMPRSSVS